MTGVSPIRSELAALALVLSLCGAASVTTAGEVTFVLRIANARLPENMRLIRVKQNDVVSSNGARTSR
jgi:hypothetical protein